MKIHCCPSFMSDTASDILKRMLRVVYAVFHPKLTGQQ